jgi:transcriptional regulator with XRE-family HTH domain
MARLSKEQWEAARIRWESDLSLSFEALANSLGVSKAAVVQFSKRNGWSRGNVTEVTGNVSGNVTGGNIKNPAKKAKAIPVITDAEWEEVDEKAERVGRKTLYDQKYDEMARKLTQRGYTDQELADHFDVHVSTLNRWKHEHASFRESIRNGKAIADAEVVESLYQRAVGYSHPETHVSCFQGEIILTPLIKHYPPDPKSMTYWLNNRCPDKWRNRVEVKEEVTISQIPWEELKEITRQSVEKSLQKHQEFIEGRYERLGIKRDYSSD